jgi:predicted MFS family arabinose efflux permease
VRAVHGIGWAAYNTGASVLLARLAPPARRGEAVGYFTTVQGVVFAAVPAGALWLLGVIDYTGVFLLAAGCGLAVVAAMAACPPQPRPEATPAESGLWGLLERSALLPCALEYLTKLPNSATALFIPLYATYRGIPLEALLYYYLGSGVAGLVTRGWVGSWSDRLGRGWMIALGASLSVVALLLMAAARDGVTLSIAGVLYGLGQAMSSPAVMALAIDRAPPARRGAAMATYSLAFQLGFGSGGLLWGTLVDTTGYEVMYVAAAVAPLLGLGLLARSWRAVAAPAHAHV